MPGSFIGYPRDPVTNQTVGLNQSRMPKLRVPKFLSRKSSEASTTSTTSTSSASSTRSTSSIVDIEKRDFLARPSSIDGPPAYEYPKSEQPRHPSISLSPKEAKALAKAQEKARRKAQRAIENEQAMKELREMDKIMRYAGMAPCSSRLH